MRQVAATDVPAPKASPFRYEFTEEAAAHNTTVLEAYDFDLAKVIDASPGSHISYGSELRPAWQLAPLLRHHPTWDEFHDDMLYGIEYPFAKEITEETRKTQLQANMERGNHKSALREGERQHVSKLMRSDVENGYAIPITPDGVRSLKDAEVYPVGLQDQHTIDDHGNIIPKKRVTHDLSHNRSTGESVNQRVDMSKLKPARYGHAMSRVLHLIHGIRRRHPGQRILCNKFDIDKAYRRLHTRASTAAKCIAMWFFDDMWKGAATEENSVGLLLTRLPFGSSPAPDKFCTVSETVFDLGGDLLACEEWDPLDLPSPYADVLPDPKRLDDEVPFGEAEEADVALDEPCIGGVDGYIDDGITVALDTPATVGLIARARQAVAMAMFLVFRPLAKTLEAIARPDILSLRKMHAEGGLHELVTFLGWLIDTRRLTIALPEDKWLAYSKQIRACMAAHRISGKDLKTLVGRLNHVCFVIPDARHFMSRLRALERRAAASNKFATLDDDTRADLALWLNFLHSAKDGISLNRVVFRKPTLQSYSDASEFGIGGYSPSTGVAWRYEFTESQQRAFTLNCKEYLGLVIDSVIQSQHDPSPRPFPCYLHWSDSTSTVGWQRKSNFDYGEMPIHAEIARFHARHMMKANACHYSQHLPGCENIIADCLSRDFHLSDAQLTALLTSLDDSPHTKPLQIVEVPDKLISWISTLELLSPATEGSLKGRSRSTLAAGISGWTSSSESSTQAAPIWTSSTRRQSFASAVRLCMRDDAVTLGSTHALARSSRALPERPSIMWQRPSSQVIGRAPS